MTDEQSAVRVGDICTMIVYSFTEMNGTVQEHTCIKTGDESWVFTLEINGPAGPIALRDGTISDRIALLAAVEGCDYPAMLTDEFTSWAARAIEGLRAEYEEQAKPQIINPSGGRVELA